MHIISKTFTKHPDYSTAVSPSALAVYSDCGSSFGVGLLFPSYTRPISVRGSSTAEFFWDKCRECPMYLKRSCSGGHLLTQRSPGRSSMTVETIEGSLSRYYNSEFCSMYYNTETLRSASSRKRLIHLELLPHLFLLKRGYPFWFIVRPGNNNIELFSYRIFNTYGNGEICMGSTRDINGSSIESFYETFLSGTMNNDLNPSNMDITQWVRSFDTEPLTNGTYCGLRWKTPADRFCEGRDSRFFLLPLARSVTFVELTSSETPSELPSQNHYFPIIETLEGEYYTPVNPAFRFTEETTPEIYRRLINYVER